MIAVASAAAALGGQAASAAEPPARPVPPYQSLLLPRTAPAPHTLPHAASAPGVAAASAVPVSHAAAAISSAPAAAALQTVAPASPAPVPPASAAFAEPPAPPPAASLPQLAPPPLTARAWLLLDATSGQVLGEHDADLRIEPASLTKIMTAYLVFQALQERRIALDQQVVVSARAWKVAPGSSKMFLEPGKRVAIGDLLSGLLIQSGNDAAIALAEAVSGSVEAFVERMNQTAVAMGLRDTHFASPHGLPDPQTYSTARDLAMLARRIQRDYPQSRAYDTTREFTYNNITQSNRNRLLWLDPSVDGLKTGHTEAAGYCIVASAQRPAGPLQRRLIAVVTGTASDKLRTQESRTLLEWGFRAYDTVRLYARGESAGSAQVWKGTAAAVKTGFAEDVFLSVPAGARIERQPLPSATLFAPLAAGAPVGAVQVSVDGKPALQVPVVALEPVAQAGLAGRAWDTVRLWLQ